MSIARSCIGDNNACNKVSMQGMQKIEVDLSSQIDRNPSALICWKFRHLVGTRGAIQLLLNLENLRQVTSRFRNV